MGLFVSTTGTTVDIPELGITITHPTTDFNVDAQFSSNEIERASTLTSLIQAGTLVWRKVAAGAIQTPSDYDSNYLEVDEENTGPGPSADRTVTFKDLGGGVTFASPVALSPDSGNIDGVSTSASRADHKHDLPAAAPVAIGTANSEGASSSVARADHVHDHGSQTTGTHHAVATTSVAGFMSATDKTKLNALVTKSGIVAAGTFAGNPKKATVTFSVAFASASYNVAITGADARTWTIESKVAGSFVISANANQALTGDVYWQAQLNGEVG